MLDNEIIKIFLPIINQGLVDYGYSSVVVRQAYHPTQQGTEELPSIYFHKIFDKKYGHPYKFSYYDSDLDVQKSKFRQLIESSFQIICLALQNPSDTNSLTSLDYLNAVCEILQRDMTIHELKNNNIGILRISDIRSNYFYDDRNQFEQSPSFDLILRHSQDMEYMENYIETINGEFYTT